MRSERPTFAVLGVGALCAAACVACAAPAAARTAPRTQTGLALGEDAPAIGRAVLFAERPSAACAGPPASLDAAFYVALDEIHGSAAESTVRRVTEPAEHDTRPKSPTKALLLSAFVPGLGQLYSGHAKVGMIYLGIEAAGWTGFSILRTDGFAKRRDARRFADAHYDSTVYNVARERDPQEPPNRPLPYRADGTLDDLEYYEDISKLNELIWGWDDHVPALNAEQMLVPGTSANRQLYQEQRNDGNADIRNARNLSIGLFVNHVVSAFHAFKLVKWYNKSLKPEISGYRIKVKETRDKGGYMVVVSRKF
jgi:hypothetical protein